MKAKIKAIRERIDKAAQRVGRSGDEIELMLVTKTVPFERVEPTIEAGVTLFGENRIQELVKKWPIDREGVEIMTLPWKLHFIGHLQSNKIKDAIRYSHCIESIDRISLAERLQRRLEFEDKSIDVFLQVNTSYEESKFGVDPKEALQFAKEVAQLDRLRIRGLMTIGLFAAEESKIRPCFKLLKEVQKRILDAGIPVNELSMGMSNDFEIAVEEGATTVRIGTALFGERPLPDSYYWNESR